MKPYPIQLGPGDGPDRSNARATGAVCDEWDRSAVAGPRRTSIPSTTSGPRTIEFPPIFGPLSDRSGVTHVTVAGAQWLGPVALAAGVSVTVALLSLAVSGWLLWLT